MTPPPVAPHASQDFRAHLRAVGECLFGPRWQRDLARALAVPERSLQRWAAGDVPRTEALIRAQLEQLLLGRAATISALTRDRAAGR